MVVLSVLNKKGGVGKTTISVNIAQGLAIIGKKVLVIDNDEQHNLSSLMGLSARDCPRGLVDVLSASPKDYNRMVAESIYEVDFMRGLHCIPGSKGLDIISPPVDTLKKILSCDTIKKQKYDVVIIDNPPMLLNAVRCAIACSDYFLLPVQLKQLAIDGLAELFHTLTVEYKIHKSKIYIVRNMYRAGITSRKVASESLVTCYPDNVLGTIIAEDEIFEKMSKIRGKSMFLARAACRGTLLFQDLICEIFGFDENETLKKFENKIKEYRSFVAKENLKKAQIINLSFNYEVEA